MLRVGEILLNNACSYPERFAIISENRALTYSELNDRCNRIANALVHFGAVKGTRVGVILHNCIEWVEMMFACQKIGAVFIPFHAKLASRELEHLINLTDCEFIVYSEEFSEIVGSAKAKGNTLRFCVGNTASEGECSFRLLEDFADNSSVQYELDGSDESMILFTSGTTGMNKGVVKTQEVMYLHGITLALKNNSPYDHDIMMSTSPLYHIGALQALLKMFVLGGTFITLRGVMPENIVSLIEKYNVTQLQILPSATYEKLYYSSAWRGRRLSGVWEVCVSAGKCTKDYTDHIFEMFPSCHLRPSWGSTEACSLTCMQLTKENIEEHPEMVNAVGRIFPMTRIILADDNGNPVKEGIPGEALVKSPMVFDGYINNAEPREAVFTPDGWYRTGDVMRVDPQTGLYYFVDRKKDIIKTGGENVYAKEIEQFIQTHPSVLECAVIGVPDDRFGEGIAAAIVLKNGSTLTGEELVAFCRENLAGFKKPRYMCIMEKLPVNSVGKVQKGVLRERASELFRPLF